MGLWPNLCTAMLILVCGVGMIARYLNRCILWPIITRIIWVRPWHDNGDKEWVWGMFTRHGESFPVYERRKIGVAGQWQRYRDRDAILWYESWWLLVASELHPSVFCNYLMIWSASHISMIFNQDQFWLNIVVVAKFRGSVCRVSCVYSGFREGEKSFLMQTINVPFDCKSLFILLSE